MKIAILCTALLALLQLGLGLTISIMRFKYEVPIGTPSDPDHPLSRVSTAFSNCCQWHPLLIILMVILQIVGAPPWSLWLAPATVVVRSLMVTGLATFPNSRPNSFRLLGGIGTYLITLILSFMIIITYLPSTAVGF